MIHVKHFAVFFHVSRETKFNLILFDGYLKRYYGHKYE